MFNGSSGKIHSLLQLYEAIPAEQRFITDVLRSIVKNYLPSDTREKFSFNVPFFYRNKGICIIWPAAIPRGGITTGVLLGFWYGNKLKDPQQYLEHGTNKKVLYKIFRSVEEINITVISILLKEAVAIDEGWAS